MASFVCGTRRATCRVTAAMVTQEACYSRDGAPGKGQLHLMYKKLPIFLLLLC